MDVHGLESMIDHCQHLEAAKRKAEVQLKREQESHSITRDELEKALDEQKKMQSTCVKLQQEQMQTKVVLKEKVKFAEQIAKERDEIAKSNTMLTAQCTVSSFEFQNICFARNQTTF